jgi:hypothetical protein
MPKQAKAKSTLSEITAKQKQDFERFDEILKELVESDSPPTYEHFLYASQLGIDAPAFKAQLRRMSRVVSFQQVAGSAKDRTELLAAADDAEQLLATDGEKLLEQIATLQADYNRLEAKAKQLRKRCTEATKAVSELKTLVPDMVRQEYSLRKRMLQETLGREISDRMTRAKSLEIVLDGSKDRFDQTWLETLRLFDHKYVAYTAPSGPVKKVLNAAVFDADVPKLQQELDEIRAELVPMRKQYEAEVKAMLETLEVYSK